MWSNRRQLIVDFKYVIQSARFLRVSMTLNIINTPLIKLNEVGSGLMKIHCYVLLFLSGVRIDYTQFNRVPILSITIEILIKIIRFFH